MGLHNFRHGLMVAVCLIQLMMISTSRAAESAEPVLSLGVFPFISTVTLFKRFSPLRDYLASGSGLRISLGSAKDYSTFNKRVSERYYDLVITGPNHTLVALDSGLYQVIARVSSDVFAQVMVNDNGSFQHVRDLAGRVVAVPPPASIMNQAGIRYLQSEGLSLDHVPHYSVFDTANAACEALLIGMVDAAICSTNVLKGLGTRSSGLRELGRSPSLPNMAVLVAGDIASSRVDQLRQLLVSMADEEEGRRVLQEIRFSGYIAAQASDFEVMRPYVSSLQ